MEKKASDRTATGKLLHFLLRDGALTPEQYLSGYVCHLGFCLLFLLGYFICNRYVILTDTVVPTSMWTIHTDHRFAPFHMIHLSSLLSIYLHRLILIILEADKKNLHIIKTPRLYPCKDPHLRRQDLLKKGKTLIHLDFFFMISFQCWTDIYICWRPRDWHSSVVEVHCRDNGTNSIWWKSWSWWTIFSTRVEICVEKQSCQTLCTHVADCY